MLLHAAKVGVNRLLRPLGVEVARAGSSAIPDRLRRMNAREVARLLYLKRRFDAIRGVAGDVVECGVAQGHGLLILAVLIQEELQGRKLWGFDSFQGYPQPSPEDKRDGLPQFAKGQLFQGSTSVLEVVRLLEAGGVDGDFIKTQLRLVQGFFDQTLERYRGSGIALLHVDVDLYQSYLVCLEILYPRVVSGGVVLFGDYLDRSSPGARRAIDHYFRDQTARIERDRMFGKYYLIKRAPAP